MRCRDSLPYMLAFYRPKKLEIWVKGGKIMLVLRGRHKLEDFT